VIHGEGKGGEKMKANKIVGLVVFFALLFVVVYELALTVRIMMNGLSVEALLNAMSLLSTMGLIDTILILVLFGVIANELFLGE